MDVPAASYKCARNALWWSDGCGTTLPHLGLGIVQWCASVQSLSWCLIAPFSPSRLLPDTFLAASTRLEQCGILGLNVMRLAGDRQLDGSE